MPAIEEIRARIPEPARDIRLNLQSVMESSSLTPEQRWGVAVASAIAARNPDLRDAVMSDARGQVRPEVIDDAVAAAALMAMNNVFYRFRHVIAKDSYAQIPARLRMQRIAKPAASKVDFELFCMAVSAINACETCVRSHEKVVIEGGLTEQHVVDAVRIAATMNAAAISLELGVEVLAGA